MNQVISFVHTLLQDMGIGSALLKPLTALVVILGIILCLVLIYYLLSRMFEPLIDRFTRHTSYKWDDILLRHKALRWVWILITVLIANTALPASLADYPDYANVVSMVTRIFLIIAMAMIIIETTKSVFLLIADNENVDEIAEQMRRAQDSGEEYEYVPSHSLKGLQQMLVIIISGIAIILIISILIGKDPLIIFSGLGAAAAVLMLIFQDSILGVVAGIQLTVNDMLTPGDWINVPKFGANGIVQEVTLATVKVQNWDHTIVTIPPYKLITEGFQNWRGMQDSKGRRVARWLNIDLTSIRFCTPEEIERWSKEPWWHISEQTEVSNMKVLRSYLEYYLTTIPTFVPNMLYMIRELQPTSDGLPMEVYFFTSNIEWKAYEKVQADTFDHIIAMIGSFGLRLYQRPTSQDFRR